MITNNINAKPYEGKLYPSTEAFGADREDPTYTTVKISVCIDWDETFKLLALTNAERKAAGLSELVLDERLCKVSCYRVAEAVILQGHISACELDSALLPKRLEYLGLSFPFQPDEYGFKQFGENVSQNGKCAVYHESEPSSRGAGEYYYNNFVNSKSHHENFMKEGWNVCGMAIGADGFIHSSSTENFAVIDDLTHVQPMPKKTGVEWMTFDVKIFSNYFDYELFYEKNPNGSGGTADITWRKVGCKPTVYIGSTERVADWAGPVDAWYAKTYDYITNAGNYYIGYENGDLQSPFKEYIPTWDEHTNSNVYRDMARNKPFDWDNLTYTSSDPSVLTISADGMVTANKLGKVTITTTFKNKPDLTHSYPMEVIATPTPKGTFMQQEGTGYWYFNGENEYYIKNESTGYYSRVDFNEERQLEILNSGHNVYRYDAEKNAMYWVKPEATPKPTATPGGTIVAPRATETPRPTEEPTVKPTVAPTVTPDVSYIPEYSAPPASDPDIPQFFDPSKDFTKPGSATPIPQTPVMNNDDEEEYEPSVEGCKYTEKVTLTGKFKKGDVLQKKKKGKWKKASKITKKMKSLKNLKAGSYRVMRKKKKIKTKASYTVSIYPKVFGQYVPATQKKQLKSFKKGKVIQAYDVNLNQYTTIFKAKKNYKTVTLYGSKTVDWKKK